MSSSTTTFAVNLEVIQGCLSNLNLLNVVDPLVLCNELERQATKLKVGQPIPPPPPLNPSRWSTILPPKRTKWDTGIQSGYTSINPNPDPQAVEQRRRLLKLALEDESVRNCLNMGTPITSPLLTYDRLQFICFSSITVFSLNREHNQVFKDSWCMWDFYAEHTCMVASDSLDEDVKAGVDGSTSLPMDLMMWGSLTKINCTVTIESAAQLPNQTTSFIFGRNFSDLLKEHPVMPVAIDDCREEPHA